MALRGVISWCGGVARAQRAPPCRVLSALMKCAQLRGTAAGRCPARPASLAQPRLLGS